MQVKVKPLPDVNEPAPPILPTMQERALTWAVALAAIAMTGPAVERDWGLAITPFEIVLLSAIVAAGFVAVGQLPPDHTIRRA